MRDAQEKHDRHARSRDHTDRDAEATFGQRQTNAAPHAIARAPDKPVPLPPLLPKHLHYA